MRDVTPAACAEVRRALEVGVAEFRRWGIAPPPGSWIKRAATRLDQVVARESLGENDDELRETSAAIALAVDLYHIGISLGTDPNRRIAAELASVAHGRLLGRGDSAAGSDYMSQFWIGTLLAHSSLQPRVVAADRLGTSKPDFVVSKGGIDFAVEVKRPRTRGSAVRAVVTAGRQLRDHSGPGIVAVDATECISVDPWAVTRSGPTTREQVRQELAAVHSALAGVIHSRPRASTFRQVAMLMTFARFWSWIIGDLGDPVRDAGLHFHARSFSYLWSNQVTGVTRDIQHALLRGVEQLTGNPPKFEFY